MSRPFVCGGNTGPQTNPKTILMLLFYISLEVYTIIGMVSKVQQADNF